MVTHGSQTGNEDVEQKKQNGNEDTDQVQPHHTLRRYLLFGLVDQVSATGTNKGLIRYSTFAHRTHFHHNTTLSFLARR